MIDKPLFFSRIPLAALLPLPLLLLGGCGDSSTAGTGSQAGNAIQVALVTSTDRPAAGARLTLFPLSPDGTLPSPGEGIEVIADREGEAVLELTEGEWVAEAVLDGEGFRWKLSGGEDGANGEKSSSVRLAPFAQLTGITPPRTSPQEAAIEGTLRRASVDPTTGLFVFDSLPPGEAVVQLLYGSPTTPTERISGIEVVSGKQEIETDWATGWKVDFGPEGIDRSIWSIDTGFGENGWGNNHLSRATDRTENLRVSDSSLILTAREESGDPLSYTSARLSTAGTRTHLYGRFTARIRLPAGAGLLSLLSLQSGNAPYGAWPRSGSIDLAAAWGEPLLLRGQLHRWDEESSEQLHDEVRCIPEGGDFSEWVTVQLQWRPGEFEWSLDGESCGVTTDREFPFDHPYFLRIEIMVGGTPVGNPPPETLFPAELEVDYLTVDEWRPRL